MAPQDTNTPKETRRHAGPLIGIAAAVLFALLAFGWWIWNVTEGPDETETTPTEQATPPTADPAAAPARE